MRVDLSTPLLDTLNDKLTEPSLDCKTLAYDPSKLPSLEALTTPSQVTSQQVTLPVISQNSPAPTVTVDCSDGITGPRQYNGCTGYYFCVYGKAVYPSISCPDDTLFDERSDLCLPSEQVTCSGTSNPTNAPSRRSTTLSPSTHPNQLISSSPSISSSSTSSLSPTIPDETSPPTWLHNATTNTRPKQSSSPTIQYPNRMPTSSPSTGTDLDASQAPMSTPNYQTSSPNQTSTSQTFGEESVISQAANDTEDEDPLFVCNHDSYTGIMTLNGCSEYFYCLNGVAQLPTMKCDKGFLVDTSSNSCAQASQVICEPLNHSTTHHTTTSTPLHQPDNVTSSSNLINSPLSGDVTSNDYVSANSSLQYSNPSITGRNPGPMMYSWIVTTYSTSSSQGSIPAESPPNSLLSQNTFPGDDPFITIEISFNNTSPADIGWQLLSLDEVVNINQPVGAYKGMAALNTIVYESIVLKQMSIKRSASMREYSWSIINMKGKFDGQYKIYAGAPNSEALVIGSDFIYMDTVGLVTTDDGVFLASSDALDDEKPATDDKGVSVQPLADPAQKLNESVQTEAKVDQQDEDREKTSIMIPILISLVLLALIGGVGLIICAYRKKKEDMNESDLTGDLDDWDVEARPKELETASSSSSFYDTFCLSGIDPPGSTASVFNSYESKPVADINTDIVSPPPDSEQQEQLTAVNDFLIDLKAAVDSLNQGGTDMSVDRLLTESGIMSSNPHPIDDSYRQNQASASDLRRNSGVVSICLESPPKS